MEQIAKIVVRVRIVIPRDEIAFDAHFFKGSDTFFERPRAALVTKKNQSIRLARAVRVQRSLDVRETAVWISQKPNTTGRHDFSKKKGP